MKKTILIVLFLIVSGCAFAQTTAEKEIMTKAEEWFKQSYVEVEFNDPYSYRLMGIKLIPVTTKEALQINLDTILYRIEQCTIPYDERNQEGFDAYEQFYEENLAIIKEEQQFIDKGEDVEYHKRRKELYIEYASIALDRMKQITLYLLDLEYISKVEYAISGLTKNDADIFVYYDVRLDCYAKNSIGNEVLGRYSFPFTSEGPFYDEQSSIHVEKLN